MDILDIVNNKRFSKFEEIFRKTFFKALHNNDVIKEYKTKKEELERVNKSLNKAYKDIKNGE